LATFLTIGALAIHLLAMNIASAGPLLGIWLARSQGGISLRDQIGRQVAWLSVWTLCLGMLTGGLLYLVRSPGLTIALERLPSRALWFAALELAFSFCCLLLYAGCWTALRQHRWWHASLALLSSSNLLYHFPPLMTVLAKVASDPNWAKPALLDRAALLPLMAKSEVLAMTCHFVLASVAVAALAVLWLLSRAPDQPWEQAAQPLARRAAWTALLVSLLQVPTGIWLLVTLPHPAQSAMLGTSPLASLAFLGSLLLTFLLLQRLLTIAIGWLGVTFCVVPVGC